ncbi:hypothetical protein F4055_04310 [Candidatus Poribacteria bacterium]|nr:hypothetical protein [Candidatus Poribacteria bacterium]
MKIDYLVPKMYQSFDLEAKRNAGGGMLPNIHSRASALRTHYDVRIISDVEEIQSDFCLIESLWFSLWRDIQANTVMQGDVLGAIHKAHAARLTKLFEKPAAKIVTCCELELARLPWWSRAKIKHYPLGVVVNTPYLWDILTALGITPIGYLCDAIDPYLFKPAKKELSVIACGGLKHIKNPYLIFEVFERLKGKMRRIYIGNAEVWSNENRTEDLELVEKIRACTDVWIPNASYIEVAYHLSTAGIGINDTWHDVSSRINQEMLMAGVISVAGQHPLFKERPGFHGLKTAEAFVETISEITNNFSEIPASEGNQGRNWACKNVSADVFIQQFNELLINTYL